MNPGTSKIWEICPDIWPKSSLVSSLGDMGIAAESYCGPERQVTVIPGPLDVQDTVTPAFKVLLPSPAMFLTGLSPSLSSLWLHTHALLCFFSTEIALGTPNAVSVTSRASQQLLLTWHTNQSSLRQLKAFHCTESVLKSHLGLWMASFLLSQLCTNNVPVALCTSPHNNTEKENQWGLKRKWRETWSEIVRQYSDPGPLSTDATLQWTLS